MDEKQQRDVVRRTEDVLFLPPPLLKTGQHGGMRKPCFWFCISVVKYAAHRLPGFSCEYSLEKES